VASDLIDTTEMYLKSIYELEEEGVVPLRARIAERLQQSGPTVSQTVARMERDGLLHVDADRHLELTEEGRMAATRVMRKHRLVERLLVDVIGLEWPLAHNEACRWEHVVSDDVERRLVGLLHDPSDDPYGNPIPALAEHGRTGNSAAPQGLITLAAIAARSAVDVVIRRISEPLQVDEDLLTELRSHRVVPGANVKGERTDTGFRLTLADGGVVDIDDRAAAHVFVTPA